MLDLAFNHQTVEKRSSKIGPFNILMWVLGPIGLFVALWATRSPWAFLFLLVPPLGWPVKDAGSPHAHLIRRYKERRAWKKAHKVLRSPPHGPKPRSKAKARDMLPLEQPQIITAKYTVYTRGSREEVRTLDLLADPDGQHLTAGLLLSGASHSWLEDDPQGKMGWDTMWMAAMARALSATNDPDLQFVMACAVNSSDREADIVWNLRRGRPEIMEAAAAAELGIEGYDPVDARIGSFLHETSDTVHAMGGEPLSWLMVRMPWPKNKLGRKIDLVNPQALRRSNLWRTVSKLVGAYDSSGIICTIADADGLNYLWQRVIENDDLKAIRMYRQVRVERNETVEHHGLVTPDSIIDHGSCIQVGSSFLTAGYVTRIPQKSVQAGFQENALVVPPGIHYSLCTWVEARLMSSSEREAAGKERAYRFFTKLLPEDRGVTDIKGDMQLQAIIEARERLAHEGSNRASAFYILMVVKGSSVDEVDANWDDVTSALSATYEFRRCALSDDVQDAILAHAGYRRK